MPEISTLIVWLSIRTVLNHHTRPSQGVSPRRLTEIRNIETLSEPGINWHKQIYVVRAPKSQAHPLYPAATKPRIWLSSGTSSTSQIDSVLYKES